MLSFANILMRWGEDWLWLWISSIELQCEKDFRQTNEFYSKLSRCHGGVILFRAIEQFKMRHMDVLASDHEALILRGVLLQDVLPLGEFIGSKDRGS